MKNQTNKYTKIIDLFLCISFGILSLLCVIFLFLDEFKINLLLSMIGFTLLSLAYSPLIKKTLSYRLFLSTITLIIIFY